MSIDPRHLREALEFVLVVVAEGQKLKRGLVVPDGLRRLAKAGRLTTAQLATAAQVLDTDHDFRAQIAAAVTPDVVGELGYLWLARPEGWEQRLAELADAAERAAEEADLAAQLRRAERRRLAAEQATARALAEVVGQRQRLAVAEATLADRERELSRAAAERAELHDELAAARTEARHARDREAAATLRADAADAARAGAEAARDGVLVDRALLGEERAELARLAAAAQTLARRLAAFVPTDGPRPARQPIALPGSAATDPRKAAELLLGAGAAVIVDGYNVAKLGWPQLDLAAQRARLIDLAENAARRFAADITVVFDGAEVIGASAPSRRMVRVVYSPAGVIADDVIRNEVGRLPPSRQVVVVTDDQAILRDVREQGANTLASRQLLDAVR